MGKKLSDKDAPKFITVKECGKKVTYEQLEIKFPPLILKKSGEDMTQSCLGAENVE